METLQESGYVKNVTLDRLIPTTDVLENEFMQLVNGHGTNRRLLCEPKKHDSHHCKQFVAEFGLITGITGNAPGISTSSLEG